MQYQSKIIESKNDSYTQYINSIAMEILGTEKYTTHPDFHIISDEEKTSIGIQKIQKISDSIFLKSYSGKGKILLIQNSHLLTKEAQNSLLKILEEPPKYTQIILHTKNLHSIIETILSRCIILNVENIKTKKIGYGPILNNTLQENIDIANKLGNLKTTKEKVELFSSILKNEYNFIKENFVNKNIERKKIKKGLLLLELINNTHKKLNANTNTKILFESFIFRLQSMRHM